MNNKDTDNKWFKNVQKSDTGVSVTILPSDTVSLRASSSSTNNNVRNITDGKSSTKWTSNYNIQTYKDDFYTDRKVTRGDYSRGEIVKDGINKTLLNDNQKSKDGLRGKMTSLKNEMNKTVETYNKQKKRIETKSPSDFKKTSNVHIGNSGGNTKPVQLSQRGVQAISPTISNHYGDRFDTRVQNYMLVERLDENNGWGDRDLGTHVVNAEGKRTYIHIGNHNDQHSKWFALTDTSMRPESNIISNRYNDIFSVRTLNYLIVKRTDRGSGWGDNALSTQVYSLDKPAYQRYLNDRNNKTTHNRKIDEKINKIKRDFKSKINDVQKQLNDVPHVNVNELSVSITNDGNYIGDNKTILTNNSTINGEWIEVEIPKTLVVKKYELLPGKRDGTNEFTPFPKDFYMVGSNDTNKWEIIDSHFNYTPVYNVDNSPIVFTIDNKKKYKYVRLVISALNSAITGFHGIGAASISVLNITGKRCYTINSSCETFQSYSNKNNMSKIEGLTMMEENIDVLADLKGFNQKYQKYVKCTDITLPEMAKSACTTEDTNIQTVNDAYNTLMDNGSIKKLRNAPLTNYISVEESKKNHNSIVKIHNEIIPLRKELDAKMNQLLDSENNVHDDYKKKYDNTMYSSLVLSVVLTSSLFFIFKKL